MDRTGILRTRVSPEPDGRRRGSLERFVVTLLIIAAILWVAAFFIVRTDGFRVIVEEEASERLGLPVAIEAVGMAFPLNLQIEGLKAGEDPPAMGLRIGAAKVALGVGSLRRLHVRDAELVLMRSSEGGWAPKSLSALGELPGHGVERMGRSLVRLLDGRACSIENARLLWLNADGTVYARGEGVSLESAAVSIPGHDGYYFKLEVDAGVEPSTLAFRGMGREWLTTGSRDYVELTRSGLAAPASRFWGKTVD